MRDTDTVAGPIKALTRGLDILRLLVNEERPISATEVARRAGLHPSSASRILATLSNAGYVRKAGYQSFEPDFGVLDLGVSAGRRFALARKPREAMLRASETCAGLEVTLCVLWREQTIYFLRGAKGVEPVLFSGAGFPLHLSAPGLRFMMDMPRPDALRLLTASRERFGWPQPTKAVPATAADTLDKARASFEHDCVVLENWVEEGHVSAAINVHTADPQPVGLAVTGPATVASADRVRLWLHEIRREVESELNAPD